MEFAYQGRRFAVARAERGGREVICKIAARGRRDSEAAVRLRREYQILQELEEVSGVPRALALEPVEGELALVLEDAGVRTLADSLGAPWPLEELLRIGERLAEILSEIHARGITHQDASPANIVLNERAGPALVDFERAATAPYVPDAERMRLEADFAYLAPERSGQLDRLVDFRSDLYSLGSILYEMITGTPPFGRGDPLELVHAHVTRTPLAPSAMRPEVPGPLSNLVLKLLSKAPEHRYQSAAALAADLRDARTQLRERGAVFALELGHLDFSSQLPFPEQIYGREDECARLSEALGRVRRGASESVVIQGESGVGKSSLIRALRGDLAEAGGWLASGACDLPDAETPYAPLREAAGELLRQALGLCADERALLGRELRDELGAGAGALFEIVPDLAKLTGELPPLPELDPHQAQTRLSLALQTFLRVLAARAGPLVCFLDDLQWADPATLDAFVSIATDPDSRHLLLVAAFREEEVDLDHSVTRALARAEGTSERLAKLRLTPLSPEAVEDFLVDALREPAERVRPLADAVARKTAGNPFFVRQLLRTLQRRGMLVFDVEARRWSWDVERIDELGLSEDVAEHLLATFDRLPERTRELLPRLACIGHGADLGLFAAALRQPEEELRAALQPALRDGLLTVRMGSAKEGGIAYHFAHDRIRHAAYSLLSTKERESFHRDVGRCILGRASPDPAAHEERFFEAVDQLNLARGAIEEEDERLELADLDDRAGQKAKAQAAHAAAAAYLRKGIEALPEDAWHRFRDRAWRLHREAAECAYVSGDYERSDRLVDALLAQAQSGLEKAEAHNLRIVSATTRTNWASALAQGVRALKELDYELSPGYAEWGEAEAAEAAGEAVAFMERCHPGDLSGLPAMEGAEDRAILRLLVNLQLPAWFSDRSLFSIVSARLLAFTLERGWAPESPHALANCAITLASADRIEQAEGFCRLAETLAQDSGDSRQRANVVFLRSAYVQCWLEPFSSLLARFDRCYESACRVGEMRTAGYARSERLNVAVAAGREIDAILRDIETDMAFFQKTRSEGVALLHVPTRQLLRSLKGATRPRGAFDDETFGEASFLERARPVPPARCLYHIRRLQAAVIFRDRASARAQAEAAERSIAFLGGLASSFEYALFSALARAAACDEAEAAERDELIADVSRQRDVLARWAGRCQANFLFAQRLVDAELARLSGDAARAEDAYQEAIEESAEAGAHHLRALAGELAARHAFSLGRARMGRAHLREAWEAYAQWGATAKLQALHDEFGALANEAPRSPQSSQEADIDLVGLLKAAQTISSEVSLDRLLDRLIRVGLEMAGADRALVVLEEGEGPFVRAAGTSTGAPELERRPLSEELARAREAIENARAIGEPVRRADVVRTREEEADGALGPGYSVLAVPVQRQGALLGTLYFENSLTTHAFPPQRLRIVELLSAHIAISLDNSILFERLKAEKEDNARLYHEAEQALSLREEFLGVAAHELKTPLTSLQLSVEAVASGTLQGSPESTHRACSIAARQTRRLARLVRDLLQVSRITAGRMALERERLDLASLVAEVCEGFADDLARSGSSLAKELSAVVGFWDRMRLEQLVTNLLSNAIKFGEGKPILVRTAQREGRATLAIQDRGRGIEPEHLPEIFDRFARGVSARDFGGLGLGLFIVKSIAEAHGGSVSVDSVPGEGSAFYVELPLD